ncbi:hypothetical protein [Dongia sp.]|uniref:hypothetical protein n=1 Tax=Dongia sp. TaxID=1977262 RepID=UPI0034A137B7
MRGPSFLSKLRRRSLWPVLALAYVLLFQSILGLAAANAHALAMAQHEVLGLGMLCLEDGRIVVADPAKSAPDSQVPDGDCLACKIACAAAIGMPVLPAPDATAEFIIYPRAVIATAPLAEIPFARFALFPSDLPSRAPPAALI